MIPVKIRDLHTPAEWQQLIGVFHEKLKGFKKAGNQNKTNHSAVFGPWDLRCPLADIQKKYLVLAKETIDSLTTTFFPARVSDCLFAFFPRKDNWLISSLPFFFNAVLEP